MVKTLWWNLSTIYSRTQNSWSKNIWKHQQIAKHKTDSDDTQFFSGKASDRIKNNANSNDGVYEVLK